MKVYEIKVKVYIIEDIHINEIQNQLCKIIDNSLAKHCDWIEFHKKNQFKNYCFGSLYPLAENKIYKKGNIYVLTVRTVNKELANYLNNNLDKEYSDTIKCLTTEIRIIPKKAIEKIYTLTPAILKDDNGYWKENLSFDDFEKRLKTNLIKKYNEINGTKIDEDFELYTFIEFKNKKPYSVKYKNIKLLGDKISLNISNESIAQDIAYMALGTGILENNSRGCGFVNFRWI